LDSVWDSVWDSVGTSVRDSVRDSVWDSVGDSVMDSVEDKNDMWVAPDSGAGWCYWRACYDYFFHHFKPLAEKLQPYCDIDRSGAFWWWMFKHVAIVCAPPKFKFDRGNMETKEAYRFHCADGPALLWPDGYALYYWRGVNVPKRFIENKDSITAKEAITTSNTELKRCLFEILGYERILKEIGATSVQRDDFGELLHADLADDNGKIAAFVRVKCPSTGREYINRVRPDVKTAKAAVASRWRLKPSEYALSKES
jgi:hypothetical protein